MNHINHTHDNFESLYLDHVNIPDFASAEFPMKKPDRGMIFFDENGELFGMCVSFLKEETCGRNIYEPFWAFKKGKRSKALICANRALCLHKNDILMGKVMDKTRPIYKASLRMCKYLGFKVMDENEYCSIVKLEV